MNTQVGLVSEGDLKRFNAPLESEFELPMYNPGVDIEALRSRDGYKEDRDLPWEVGQTIAGRYVTLKHLEVEDSWYVILETKAGSRFKAWAPGKLRYRLKNEVEVGTEIGITYTGKVDAVIKGVDRNIHDFAIRLLKQ